LPIVGAFDIHRRQLTYDYVDVESGEVKRGRVMPADRENLRAFLGRFSGSDDVAFAMEGCTGWRYVVEELQAAGIEAHVAEPAEAAALKGNKKRAKTDRADARRLRELLAEGRIPESWIPPTHVLEARARVRLYKDLLDERGGWHQRVQATLFHHGVTVGTVATAEGAERARALPLSPAGRQAIDVGLRQIERLTSELDPLRAELVRFARRQAGCRALWERHFGVGGLLAVAIWAEMGDPRRFSSSADAVRHSGLDVTVYSSDSKRAKGRLSRQGPGVLRWALYEAAVCAARRGSPDYAYYHAVRARLDGQLAALSVARKLARRCHHTLRELGDPAWAPVG
jgi:transposase